jgi:hypothetical protein
VNKACKSQNTLLEDGNLCALGSEFAEELSIEEGDELKIRRTDKPEKSAVYIDDEIWEQDVRLGISKKGWRRLDGKGPV